MSENSGRKQPMTDKRKHPTAFKPGQSGNPAGKPRGARNHATRAILNLIEGGLNTNIYQQAFALAIRPARPLRQ